MKIKQKLNQSGVVHLVLIFVVTFLVAIVGYSGFRILQMRESTYTNENSQEKATSSKVKIKSMPVNIEAYDPETKRAGDIIFPEQKLPEGVQPVIFSEFGYKMPGNSANGYQSQPSPQPTFIVAAGTKIRAMIDGEVVNVTKLYSGDYSIHMKGSGSDLIFEHEHVIKPLVKVGDEVKAGAVIATASDYDAKNLFGLAVFEMGLLKGGNPPIHLCVFDYLDDSIKQDTFDNINALKKSWEEFTGDSTLYDESSAIPGCLSRDPISDSNNSQTGAKN